MKKSENRGSSAVRRLTNHITFILAALSLMGAHQVASAADANQSAIFEIDENPEFAVSVTNVHPAYASSQNNVERYVTELIKCRPSYSDGDPANREDGRVRIQFKVGADGRATNTTILASSGLKGLDDVTVKGLADCRFSPRYRSGKPVANTVTAEFTWKEYSYFESLQKCAYNPFDQLYTGDGLLLPGSSEWKEYEMGAIPVMYSGTDGDMWVHKPINRSVAQSFCERALEIVQKTVGPTHPLTAYSLNNLGDLYADEGDFDRAEPLYKNALKIISKTFGPHHPYVATDLENLAFFYHRSRRYKLEAVSLKRAAEIRAAPIKIGDGYLTVAAAGNCVIALKSTGMLWAWKEKGPIFKSDGSSSEPIRSDALLIGDEFVGVRMAGEYNRREGKTYNLEALKPDGSSWIMNRECNQIKAEVDDHVATLGLMVDGGTWGSSALKDQAYKLQLRTDGSLWAWGSNTVGQLGDGTSTDSAAPVQVGTNYQKIALADNGVMALKTDGSLWTWGESIVNYRAGFFNGKPRFEPVKIGEDYRAFALSNANAFAIKIDGTLWAWGFNSTGQLGNGASLDGVNAITPFVVGRGFREVVATDYHTLALKSDGTVWAWGYINVNWCCSKSIMTHSTPVQIGSGFTTIAAGNDFAIALRPDGSLWTWPALWR